MEEDLEEYINQMGTHKESIEVVDLVRIRALVVVELVEVLVARIARVYRLRQLSDESIALFFGHYFYI